MHNFIMFTNCMQGLKTIYWKLCEEMITQIPYPII